MNEKKEVEKLEKPEIKLRQASSVELSNLVLKKELFSKLKELLNESSVEQSKLEIVQSNDLLSDSQSLAKLKSLNSKIVIPMIEKLILNIKSIDLKNFSIEKLELDEDRKAEKILAGLMDILPDKIKQAPELALYAKSGADGLALIERQIIGLSGINADEIKKTGYLLTELNELQKTLREENAIINKVLFNKKISKTPWGFLLRACNEKEELQKLKSLVAKEILMHNSAIKGIAEFKITEEYNETSQILIFEEKELEISEELEYLLNQFIIPKIDLGHEWVAYRCNLPEGFNMAMESSFVSSLPICKEQMIVNAKKLSLDYINLKINSPLHESKGDIFFLMTTSSLKHNNLHRLTDGSLRLYFSGEKIDLKKFEVSEAKINELIKNINEKMKEYIEYTKKLDDKFSEEWSQDALPLIKSDFTKRWISESSEEFFLKKDIDIVKIIICQKKYHMLQKLKPGEKSPQYESVIEQIKKMSKDEFVAEIEKVKEFCKDSVNDAKLAMQISHVKIKDYLMVAPKSNLFYIEKYFSMQKNRPSIYYYKGSGNAAVEEALSSCCIKGTNKKEKASVKLIRIFDSQTYSPLSMQ